MQHDVAPDAPPRTGLDDRRAPRIPVAREPEVGPPPRDDAPRTATAATVAAAVEAEEEAFCELLVDAYLRTDAYGVVRRANAAAATLLGRPAIWVAGKPIFTFLEGEQRHALRSLVGSLHEAGGARRWTMQLLPVGGEAVTVDATVVPVRADGHVVGARWLLRRTTDAPARVPDAPPPAVTTAYFADFLARVSGVLGDVLDDGELLRAVARHAVPALGDWCVVDLVGEDRRFDRVAVAHTVVEEHAEQAALEGAVPDPLGDHPIAVAARTRRTMLVRDGAAAAACAAGGPAAHAWLAVPMVARGGVLGVLSFVMARSGRPYAPLAISAAEELARRAALGADNALLYRRAVRASEAKSAFLGTISHELRTPLTAVIGYSELLADGLAGPLDARQAEFVHRIRESGEHLLRLVEEVLGFARLEANEERAASEPVDVAAVVRQAAETVEPQAQRRGLALRWESALPDGFVLHTDPTKLRQILVNLLGNAVKFTDAGGVTLRATLDDELGRVELAVQDTGIGIPAEMLASVFEPFWQVEQTTTRARGGAGLGLSVVRRLARLLGGDVAVESEAGRGSCFRVTLPCGARAPMPD